MVEERFMRRALDLAKKGLGRVSPNPMVGCVIVKNDIVIGEGYHEKYGGPHAEVNAVSDVGEKNVTGSTVYVTLEPCSHYGNTPPCADLLARLKPKEVIVCNVDPNPLVAGKGLKKLEAAGIQVQTGILKKEGMELNKRFFKAMNQKRPYIILKWAQTADGFIARENYDSKWISGEDARKMVHQWRAEEDAIMVGTNTAIHDNPSLNVRFGIEGKNPVRVVIDKNLRIPTSHHLFDQKQPTLCYNLLKNSSTQNIEYIQVEEDNLVSAMMSDLFKRKVFSIIVEGGSFLLKRLIELNLWDEARVFYSKEVVFQRGIEAPVVKDNYLTLRKVELQEDYLEKSIYFLK